MAETEIWITDLLEIALEGECVRAVLASGRTQIVLRGSFHTLVKALALGRVTVEQRQSAEILPLDGH